MAPAWLAAGTRRSNPHERPLRAWADVDALRCYLSLSIPLIHRLFLCALFLTSRNPSVGDSQAQNEVSSLPVVGFAAVRRDKCTTSCWATRQQRVTRSKTNRSCQTSSCRSGPRAHRPAQAGSKRPSPLQAGHEYVWLCRWRRV